MAIINSPPLVSVLIPAYNHEAYVAQAIESVLGQTHMKLELIVIDDASTDGTWGVVQSFVDSRVRSVRHEVNLGAHATLNEAVGMARGDYMAILNSDDIFSPTRLERMLPLALQADSFLFSNAGIIDDRGALASAYPQTRAYLSLREICSTFEPDYWFFVGNPALSTSNFLFSRSLAKKVGLFQPLRYTHDWDWALRACRYTTPIWVGEDLLSYRVHASNTLSENNAWRHIHENSYFQANALRAWKMVKRSEKEVGEMLRALLLNESIHPLSLLCFLIQEAPDTVDTQRHLHRTTGESGWWLSNLASSVGCPESIFGSLLKLRNLVSTIDWQSSLLDERLGVIEHMSLEVANRDKMLEVQAALVEERYEIILRMSEEIAHRDEDIAAKAALVEERYGIIQHMSREIDNRDALIQQQQDILDLRDREISHLSEVVTQTRNKLESMLQYPLVRTLLWLRKFIKI